MPDLQEALRDFCGERKFSRKGPLCVALVVTRHARNMGLPLDPGRLLTDSGGQVSGLSRSSVQAILAGHGVMRVLASEGGRTSRGSISHMREYAGFLNGLAVAEGLAENAGLGGRVDIFEAERSIALNLYELGKFAKEGRHVAVDDLVARYNEIIDEVETDPSLKIELGSGSADD